MSNYIIHEITYIVIRQQHRNSCHIPYKNKHETSTVILLKVNCRKVQWLVNVFYKTSSSSFICFTAFS